MYLNYKSNLHNYWAIDIETDDLNATVVWCIVLYNLATHERVVFGPDTVHSFAVWVGSHPDAIFVGHNAISFDVPTLNRLLDAGIESDRVVDTLVLSYLYHPAMPGGHSLEAWGERLKFPKGDFHDWTHYSKRMLEYCIRDVDLLVLLFFALTKRMSARGFSEQSCQLEHKIRVIIDKQQQNGWYFNVNGARDLQDRLRAYERELAGPIQVLFPPRLVSQGVYNLRTKSDGTPYQTYFTHLEKYPELKQYDNDTYEVFDYQDFNIGSPAQRLSRLLELGFVPKKFTKNKNPSVDEESLLDFAESSGRPEVAAIAEWLVANGRANMLGTWLANVHSDSRIHGKVMSCGAGSRRMTHSAPNTANIPSNEAKYGHEVRSLWTVHDPSTRSIVGYDAKSIQMRCYANLLPDPSLGRRYYDTDFCKDPHQENAELIGIGRKPVKNVFYANLFGAYPPKLASTAGRVGSKKDLAQYGTWIKEELYRVSPGLREATEAAQSEWRNNGGFLSCPDGGFVRCPAESAAFNYKIQPAEACVMKQAAIYIDERLTKGGYDFLKIGDIHDEGQIECAIGQEREIGDVCIQAIRDAGETFNFRVPLDGSYAIGKSWAETH